MNGEEGEGEDWKTGIRRRVGEVYEVVGGYKNERKVKEGGVIG